MCLPTTTHKRRPQQGARVTGTVDSGGSGKGKGHQERTTNVPEDEVDPLVQVLRHVTALQCLAMQSHKFLRVAAGPGGQTDVPDRLAFLRLPEVEVVAVREEVGQAVELWDEFAHVLEVHRGGAQPRLFVCEGEGEDWGRVGERERCGRVGG